MRREYTPFWLILAADLLMCAYFAYDGDRVTPWVMAFAFVYTAKLFRDIVRLDRDLDARVGDENQ